MTTKRMMVFKKVSIVLLVAFIFQMSFMTVGAESETGAVASSSTSKIESGEESYILTGSSSASSVLENDVNINAVVLDCADCNDVASSTLASSSPAKLSVQNENVATTSNTVNLDAGTGDNQVTSSGTESFISTGDITLINIIVNFINNNFFGKGQQFFIDIFNTVMGTIDLSGFGSENLVPTETACLLNNCDVSINNQSTSTLDNLVVLEADTGNNLIVNSENGYIETGDINIVNDIVNVANLNVTGEGWFFAVVNIFGALDGDVILPAFNNDFIGSDDEVATTSNEISTTSSEISTEIYIANNNMTDTINEVLVKANTGDNMASSSGEAQILSGDINLDINTFNFVNYNITGDYWKFAKINIFGDWRGFIEGLPSGFSYMEDDFGITIYNDFLNSSILNEVYVKQTVLNYNQATTSNVIEIEANTGENVVSASSGSYIHTGDINVTSSLMNFINTNFTGNNWEFSMINVFGEWQGNLAFGQGDLWITEAVSAKTINGGDHVVYTFLYGNNGDSNATNVQIEDDFDEDLVMVQELSEGVLSDGKITWFLGVIPPNTQGSFSYVVRAKSTLTAGVYNVYNQVTIAGLENDRNYYNNFASGAVELIVKKDTSTRIAVLGGMANNIFPSLKVTKTNNKNGIAYPGDYVDYVILIKNTGSANLEDVLVQDIMSNMSSGEIIKQSLWNLETLYVGEEVLIEYTIKVEESTIYDSYINEVMAEGYDAYRGQYIHAVGSSKIRIDEYVAVQALSQYPDVVVAVKTDAEFYNPGDMIELEIVVTNNGGEKATEIFLKSTLVEGLTFYGEDGKVDNSWHFDYLNPGQIETINMLLAVEKDTVQDFYDFTAIVKGDNFTEFERTVKVAVRDMAVLGIDFEVPVVKSETKEDSDSNTEQTIIVNSTFGDLGGNVQNKAESFLTSFNNTEEKVIAKKVEPEIRERLYVERKNISFKFQFFIFFLAITFLLYTYIKVSDFYFSEK